MKKNSATKTPAVTGWKNLLRKWKKAIWASSEPSEWTYLSTQVLSPTTITEYSAELTDMPLEALKAWKDEQIAALNIPAIPPLSFSYAKWLSSRLPPSSITSLIDNIPEEGITDSIKGVLEGINGDPNKLKAIGEGIHSHPNKEIALKTLITLTKQATDQDFGRILSNIPPDTVAEMMGSVEAEETFDEVEKKQMASAEKEAITRELYQGLGSDKDFEDILAILLSFENRLCPASSQSVRERVFNELKEWITDIPLKRLSKLLIKDRDIFHKMRRDQNRAFQGMFRKLRKEVTTAKTVHTETSNLLHHTYKEIKARWDKEFEQFKSIKSELEQLSDSFHVTEQKLVELIERMKSTAKATAKHKLLSQIEGLIELEKERLEEIKKAKKNLHKVLVSLETTTKALGAKLESPEEIVEGKGSIPTNLTFQLKVFKKLVSSSSTEAQKFHQLTEEMLKASTSIPSHNLKNSKVFQHLREACEMYENSFQNYHQAEKLYQLYFPKHTTKEKSLISLYSERIRQLESEKRTLEEGGKP